MLAVTLNKRYRFYQREMGGNREIEGKVTNMYSNNGQQIFTKDKNDTNKTIGQEDVEP